ncbi:MAG: hypothetical protein ABEH77_06350 [Halobacteriaceae archaeon]
MDIAERWRGVYREREAAIEELAREYPEERSLAVDIIDLHDRDPELVEALFADPDRVLRRGEAALAGLREAFDRVNVRVENHPSLVAPAAVRSAHAGELVAVEGTVQEVGPVRARIARAAYGCGACDHELRRRPAGVENPDPGGCPACGGHSLRRLDAEFVDVQRVRVGDDGAIDAYLEDDLVGAAEVEDRARITGVVRLEEAGALFDFYLTAVGADVDPGERDRPAGEAVQSLIRSRWELI